ncbi:hypothetical protein [Nonomuraea zeae]|uniref:hypothetical protein n=1 Tax=Nonomuraea zeae TaxID=1642303 RepID=UPI0014780D29|nr:hypothetical protein [Nonomuraea zeae]
MVPITAVRSPDDKGYADKVENAPGVIVTSRSLSLKMQFKAMMAGSLTIGDLL